jgi:hypothetical protein
MADGDIRELDSSDAREAEQELLRHELALASSAIEAQRLRTEFEGLAAKIEQADVREGELHQRQRQVAEHNRLCKKVQDFLRGATPRKGSSSTAEWSKCSERRDTREQLPDRLLAPAARYGGNIKRMLA